MCKYTYNFNYLNDELKKVLPPSDSRFRPDQRKYEEGQVDEAEIEKKRIEELQRGEHKKDSTNKYITYYFDEAFDTFSKEHYYSYNGEYWNDREKGDFSRIRSIF